MLAAMLLGFFVAGLLDARGIEADIKGRPLGTGRTVLLTLLRPVTALSGALGLDRPGEVIGAGLRRGQRKHHTLEEARKAKPLWPREITAHKPLRLYIAGDSMAQVFGSSLVNLAEGTGLIRARLDYHVSSGLSRPDFYDWPQRLVDQLVEFRADAAVILFGANDAQDVEYRGKVLDVGTKAWRDLYAKRVGRAMKILTSGGRRVYWVGNPIMRDAGYRDRIAMMNHIYAAVAPRYPGVTFVSTWRVMADEKGSYADYLREPNGGRVLMRGADGIHLTRAGGDRMGQFVLDVVLQDWGIGGEGGP